MPWNKRITLYLEGILVARKEKIEATQLQQLESNAMAEKNRIRVASLREELAQAVSMHERPLEDNVHLKNNTASKDLKDGIVQNQLSFFEAEEKVYMTQ